MATTFDQQLAHWRHRLHASPAGQFLRWWGGELYALLPQSLQARLKHARRRVVTRLTGGEVELSALEGQSLQSLEAFRLDQDPELLRQQITELLHRHELHELPRDLLLDDERVLRKEVVLPLAAEANLREALGFEMDRHTPFPTQKVYFDCQVRSRDREAGQLRAELVVALREDVDADAQKLEQLGLAAAGVDVLRAGLPAGMNLLPVELRQRMVNRRGRLNLLLGLVAGILCCLVMAQSLWLRQHRIALLDDAIEEVRVEARRVQAIRSQIEDAAVAAGFLAEQRVGVQPTVKVLAELTRLLPDDTYLDRLRIWSGNVQIQGQSVNAQQLIETVNGSEMFDNAEFRGPTRLDAGRGREVFDLNASLAGATRVTD